MDDMIYVAETSFGLLGQSTLVTQDRGRDDGIPYRRVPVLNISDGVSQPLLETTRTRFEVDEARLKTTGLMLVDVLPHVVKDQTIYPDASRFQFV